MDSRHSRIPRIKFSPGATRRGWKHHDGACKEETTTAVATAVGQSNDWASEVSCCSDPSDAPPLRQPPPSMPPERPCLLAHTRAVQSAQDQHACHRQGRRPASRPPKDHPRPNAGTRTHLHHRNHATSTARRPTTTPVARGPCWPQPLPPNGHRQQIRLDLTGPSHVKPPEAEAPSTTLDRCPSSSRAATKQQEETAPPPDDATAPARARRHVTEPRRSTAPSAASPPAPARGFVRRRRSGPAAAYIGRASPDSASRRR